MKSLPIFVKTFLSVWLLGLLLSIPQSNSFAEVSASIGASAVVEKVPGLVDNFNDGNNMTLNGASMGPMPDSSIKATYDSAVFYGPNGRSLKLNYDLPVSTHGWNGFWVLLAGGAAPVDVSGFTHLSFFVRGAVGGVEHLKIQLKNVSTDTARNTAFLYVNDYLDDGISLGWREVRIPLRAFANLDSLVNVNEIAFVFEADYASESAFASVGAVYIDDLGFTTPTLPLEPLRVDHFGDAAERNALGGRVGGIGDPLSAQRRFVSSEFHGSSRSMKATYDVSGTHGTSGGYTFIFGGGTDGWLSVPVNVSGYRYLKFYAKAGPEGNPGSVTYVLNSGAPAGNIGDHLTGLTSAWQPFTIDLDSFNSDQLSKSSIKQIQFLFEKGVILSAGGSIQGVVYFDQIEFSN